MVKEIAWYLESGRFSNLVEELEASLRNYEEAKKAGHGEDILETLREDARFLFEGHCVRSGMRENEAPFINIDAEFFNGNMLDEAAMNSFIKNIIKGHCFQKVLWTYMGTTGSLTAISRAEMAKAGLRYDDYLPLEYRNSRRVKKPLEELAGIDTELFYMYGDGTVSKEYQTEKAKINFNKLEDKSGINWKAGYDPNSVVEKDGWHGEYDYNGAWMRVDEKDRGNRTGGYSGAVSIELIRNGDSVILYDPGMLLLSLPVMMYLTDSGETYGNLSMDKEGTVQQIKETLKKMGIAKISAIGGIAAYKPETLSAYQALLGDIALPELYIADSKEISEIKEMHMKVAAETVAESFGIALERKLRIAGKYGADITSVLSAISNGSVTVPLSPRKISDGLALGLSEAEVNEIGSMHINPEHADVFDAVLSNLFASWTYYEGGLGRVEAARLVNESMGHDALLENNDPLVITAQTSLGEIIDSGKKVEQNDIRTFVSGIPGIFSEPAVIDFYDEKAKEKYLKSLEKKQILPRGGAVSALEALETLPATDREKKAELNRGLTRAFGQYKAIAMSIGMPLKELIEIVKTSTGFGESVNGAVLKRKIYYELSVKNLIEEAKKENLQTKEVNLENEVMRAGESVIVVGGVQGTALDEVLLTHEKLLDSGFSEEEVNKVLPFLHGIRFASPNFVIPALLLEVLNNDKVKTAEELRQNVLIALDTDSAISYNLCTGEGLQAYFESGRATGSKVSKKEIQTLLEEGKVSRFTPVSTANISMIKPGYKAQGNVVPLNRNVPKGSPEKIRPANVVMGRELPVLVFEGGDKNADVGIVELTGFRKETLEREHRYGENEVSGDKEAGIDVVGLTGFGKETLGRDYGYGENEVSGEKEAGIDVVELTGFRKETLEREYRYGENEAIGEKEAGIDVVGLTGFEKGTLERDYGYGENEVSGDKEAGIDVVELTGFRKETLEREYGYGADEASGEKEAGIDVVELTGFRKETLEREYGYGADEAEEAVRFLREIIIPIGKGNHFKRELAPVFEELLKGTNKAGILRERVRERFGELGGASFSTSIPDLRGIKISAGKEHYFKQNLEPVFGELSKGTSKANVFKERVKERFGKSGGAEHRGTAFSYSHPAQNTVPSSSFSGAVPFEFTSMQNRIENANTDSEITSPVFPSAPSAFSSAPSSVNRHAADKSVIFERSNVQEDRASSSTVNFERRNVQEDAAEGGTENAIAVESAEQAVNFPLRQVRDAELERLRKVEENYEKDKKLLNRQKQPALARSESHDVGHAEGVKKEENLDKIAHLQRKNIINELRIRKGV